MVSYEKRWEIIRELGAGGQGKVYLVRDKNSTSTSPADFIAAINDVTATVNYENSKEKAFERLRVALLDIVKAELPENQGALKVLLDSANARDPQLANERVQREIEAITSVGHPNLLRILDANPAEMWYVSEYHSGGVLSGCIDKYAANFANVLKAIRPLVEGVSHLHAAGMVHRDIKPENIFLSDDGRFILGDFGLIFFEDEEHNRISQTFENVGTRDWMPGWATGMRIEEIKPSFDVFSLGKLIWALTAGQSVLQLWYYYKPRFNVETLFPDGPSIKHANPLFAKCIVEEEKDCIPNATKLLEEIDSVLETIESGGDYIGDGSNRPCRVCSGGTYGVISSGGKRASREIQEFGMNPADPRTFRIFLCDNCGHVQLFSHKGGQHPPAWKN